MLKPFKVDFLKPKKERKIKERKKEKSILSNTIVLRNILKICTMKSRPNPIYFIPFT